MSIEYCIQPSQTIQVDDECVKHTQVLWTLLDDDRYRVAALARAEATARVCRLSMIVINDAIGESVNRSRH